MTGTGFVDPASQARRVTVTDVGRCTCRPGGLERRQFSIILIKVIFFLLILLLLLLLLLYGQYGNFFYVYV